MLDWRKEPGYRNLHKANVHGLGKDVATVSGRQRFWSFRLESDIGAMSAEFTTLPLAKRAAEAAFKKSLAFT